MPDASSPREESAQAEDSAHERTPPEETPYRALLDDDSFDITLNERAGVLTLQAASGEEGRSTEAAYRFEPVGEGHFLLIIGGRSVPVVLTDAGEGQVRVTLGGRTATVRVQDETDLLLERFGIEAGAGAAEAEVRAPMPGLVVRVLVEEGQPVEEGDGLLVLEAMKMENELCAPAAGTVAALHAEEGASADKGEVLVEIEAA